jgi:hypothetical protein
MPPTGSAAALPYLSPRLLVYQAPMTVDRAVAARALARATWLPADQPGLPDDAPACSVNVPGNAGSSAIPPTAPQDRGTVTVTVAKTLGSLSTTQVRSNSSPPMMWDVTATRPGSKVASPARPEYGPVVAVDGTTMKGAEGGAVSHSTTSSATRPAG